MEKFDKYFSTGFQSGGFAQVDKIQKPKTMDYRSIGKIKPKAERPKATFSQASESPYSKDMNKYFKTKEKIDNILDKGLGLADVATDIAQIGNFVPHPAAQAVGKTGSIMGAMIDGYQAYKEYNEGDYGASAVNFASLAIPGLVGTNVAKRNSKHLIKGDLMYGLQKNSKGPLGGKIRTNYINIDNKTRGIGRRELNANRTLFGAVGVETMLDAKEIEK